MDLQRPTYRAPLRKNLRVTRNALIGAIAIAIVIALTLAADTRNRERQRRENAVDYARDYRTTLSGSGVVTSSMTIGDVTPGSYTEPFTYSVSATTLTITDTSHGRQRYAYMCSSEESRASSNLPALGSCGVRPLLVNAVSSDESGVIETGDGASGCVITFERRWETPPRCIVQLMDQ